LLLSQAAEKSRVAVIPNPLVGRFAVALQEE